MSYIKCLEEVFFVKTSNTISKHRAYLYKPFRSLQSVGWVPGRGIEPPRVAPYGPEPYASTNFAIQATPRSGLLSIKTDTRYSCISLVPETGIEPTRVAPHAPQACASTNFATQALNFQILSNYTTYIYNRLLAK